MIYSEGYISYLATSNNNNSRVKASALYKKLQDNISEFRKIVDRPLTLSEKILKAILLTCI